MAYNDILDYLEETMENDSTDAMWKFRDIVAHEGPLKPTDPSNNGSPYNVLVVWEDQCVHTNPYMTLEPIAQLSAQHTVNETDY